MRPLVRKWMHNYQAAMCPPSSVMLGQKKGREPQKESRVLPKQPFLLLLLGRGALLAAAVQPGSSYVFKAARGSKKKVNSSKEVGLLHIVRLVYEALYNLQESQKQLRALDVESQPKSLFGCSFYILYFIAA